MNAIKELGDLFESYYKICGKLYANMELVGKQLYDTMAADVEKTYKDESKRLMREAKIEYEAASYELDCKEDNLLPGRCGLFWLKRNKAADIIYREVWAQTQKMFKDRTEAIERLEKALDKASENVNPFDEPAEPKEPGAEQTEQDKPKEPPEQAEQPKEPKEPAPVKTFSIQEFERYMQELADDVKVKPFAEVWDNIRDRIYSPQGEQKPAENGKQEEVKQTDKPEETKPQNGQKRPKTKKETPEQLPGQMTLDDVQAKAEQTSPETATTSQLTAKKEAVTPQTRTQEEKNVNNSNK